MKFLWPLLFLLLSCGKEPLFLSLAKKNTTKSVQELNASERYFKNTSYAYTTEWLKGPYNVGHGASEFKLRIWDKNTATFYGPFLKPIEKVCAFLWMKMPDGSEHGSSPLELSIIETEDGPIFHYTEAYFLMNGKWRLYITLINDNESCLFNPSQKGLSQAIHEINIQ